MSKRRENFESQGDETPVPDEGTVREVDGEPSIREESADAMGPEGDLRISASDGNRDTLCVDDQLEQFVSPGMELPTELVAEQKAVLLRKGDVVADRFRVGKQLGFGGMGAVYQVKDRYLGMEKALKVMLPSLLGSETARQRFRDEVAITQQLAHENIVRIYDLSTDRKRKFYFFTMELIEGKTLNRLIRERAGRLTLDEALDIALQLCHALEYAHEYTIHRDLKPQNIMVRPDGSIKILDFGLAKLMTPGRMTRSSMALGTAYYQAPEQSIHIKELDQRADIYSVGVILYQMLTGDIPVGRVKAPSKLVSTVPTALDKIVLTCIEPEPAERYESATALKEALEKFVKQQKRAQDTRPQERKRPKHDESSTSLSAGARTLLRSFVHDCKGEWTQEQFDDLARQVRALPDCGNVSEKTVEKALDTALRTWRRDVEMKQKLEEYVEKPPTKGRRALFGPLKIGIGIMAFLALCALPLILLFATTDINPPKPEGNETEGAETPAVTWLEGAYAGDTVTVDLGDGVTMDMVWCPKGTFEMGDESGHPDEQPVHEVRITEGFWLGRYEVTQAQWKAVTGHNPAKFVQGDHPVESVSWIDCRTFLKKLEAEVGGEFRLPTEAEWEYACRAGSTSTYCFGNLAEELQEYAWYAENSDGHTHPVGTKAANAWRFHDMHGNVAEWCQDWYDREFYSQSPVENPCNTDTGNHRTMRGGSWLHIVGNCRSASRLNGRPPDASHNVGLRVVASLPSTTPIGDPHE